MNDLNLIRPSAITYDLLAIFGSIMKFFPLLEPGGKAPVVINFKASIIVFDNNKKYSFSRSIATPNQSQRLLKFYSLDLVLRITPKTS